MNTVVLETPYAGDVELNIKYARACLRDCLLRGEAPFASHLLYTQPDVLNDDDPAEGLMGIGAGLVIGDKLDATVVYQDLGVSRGMEIGITLALKSGRPIEYRRLHGTDALENLKQAAKDIWRWSR